MPCHIRVKSCIMLLPIDLPSLRVIKRSKLWISLFIKHDLDIVCVLFVFLNPSIEVLQLCLLTHLVLDVDCNRPGVVDGRKVLMHAVRELYVSFWQLVNELAKNISQVKYHMVAHHWLL